MACRSASVRAGSVGFDDAIQMEIDAKQKEIDRIKYLADRRDQFTDEFAPSYWRVWCKDEVL